MKKLKSAIAIITAFLVLMINLSFFTVSADEVRYGVTVINKMPNSDEYQFIYNTLLEGFKSKKTEVTLAHNEYSVSPEELSTAYDLVMTDYPEIYWVDPLSPYGYSYYQDGSNTTVTKATPNYKSELLNKDSVFNSKINSLISGLSGKSDYEKALILHDRLAELVTYIPTNNDQTAYGALVEGKAVCAGYARAYQLLLQEVGITAWSVIGSSINPATNQSVGHEWNIAKLDGKWYYTDVTWDDQGEDIFYAYFNITTNQLKKDHTITQFEQYLPVCDSTIDNYFAKNNLIYSSVDVDRIGNDLKKNNLTTRIFVNGSLNGFINQLSEKILLIAKKAGLPNGYGYSTQLKYIGNEIILSVKFIDPNHVHSLTPIKKVEPTCISKGCKAYYKCNCGDWFSDANGKQKITDKNSLEIAVTAHTNSGWKTNANEHYKECTKCGIETANSRNTHTDKNKDYKCDTCGYSLPKPIPEKEIPTVKPTETTDKKDNNSSNSSSKVDSSQSTNSNTSTQSATTEETVENNNTNDEIAKNDGKKDIKYIIIPVAIGGVALLSGGFALIKFLIRK